MPPPKEPSPPPPSAPAPAPGVAPNRAGLPPPRTPPAGPRPPLPATGPRPAPGTQPPPNAGGLRAPSPPSHNASGVRPAGAPQPMPPQPSGPSGVPQPIGGPFSSGSATAPHGPSTAPHGAASGGASSSGAPFGDPYGAPNPFGSPSAPASAFPSGPTQPNPGSTDPQFGLPQARVVQGTFGPQTLEGDDDLDLVPGSQFVKFLKISARRAFRLRIEPTEVLPSERSALVASSPPVTDPNLQAFLAWRRSVLFLVATSLALLTFIGLIDSLRGTNVPMPIRMVRLAPALAEGVFCYICWIQLKKWTQWRKQRRLLFYGWLLFLITPFVVFVYPLQSIVGDLAHKGPAMLALGWDGAYRQAVAPFVFAMLAMLQLAPKAISLMPGLTRASLVIKLLFPGVSGPGWLIAAAAPLYALLAYVILIIPYQFTGSGYFVFGILGVIAGQLVLARAGTSLAKPMSEDEALAAIKRVRKVYISVMVVSGLLIIVALWHLVDVFHLRTTDVFLAVMKFETNVLILTMIGADLVITYLDRARSVTAGRGHVEVESEVKIAAFRSRRSSASSRRTCRRRPAPRRSRYPTGATSTANPTRAPPPGRSVIHAPPPWATAIRDTSARPSPRPPPLDGTNARNASARRSAATPGPASSTSTAT
jgi:hypothetical protein